MASKYFDILTPQKQTSKQTTVTLNDFWELGFFYTVTGSFATLFGAANSSWGGRGQWRGVRKKGWENSEMWGEKLKESDRWKEGNRSVGAAEMWRSTEGRLSKTRTGQGATTQPPFSLPHFHFPVPLRGERDRKMEIQSQAQELKWLNLLNDSLVWFPWKLTERTWWPESCKPYTQRSTMITAFGRLKIQRRPAWNNS